MRWVVKLSNGRGYVQWYRSLCGARMQGMSKDEGHQFSSKEAAEQALRAAGRRIQEQ